MTYLICKKFTFEASHKLWDNLLSNEANFERFGKCANPPSHGHSYKVFVYLKSKKLKNGMVRNFSELKEVFNKRIYNKYDHQFLNLIINKLTTAENLAEEIYKVIKRDFKELWKIRVYETETNYAEYWEE